MTDKATQRDEPRGSDSRDCATQVAADDLEQPRDAPVEEFLQALPAVTQELSEALTAISAYLTGSHHIFERGGGIDRVQSAIEQARCQTVRANEAVRRLRESFRKLGRS